MLSLRHWGVRESKSRAALRLGQQYAGKRYGEGEAGCPGLDRSIRGILTRYSNLALPFGGQVPERDRRSVWRACSPQRQFVADSAEVSRLFISPVPPAASAIQGLGIVGPPG